jgi:hypothetical protein
MEKAWLASEAAYFGRSIAWPKKSSPRSYSWKMSQLLLPGVDSQSLGQLPKWGMIVDGVLYPLQALERYIVGKGGSYWATPNTMDGMELRSDEAMRDQFTHARKGRTKPANLREQVHAKCWPQNLFLATPTATTRIRSQRFRENRLPNPQEFVEMWPTPKASDGKRCDSPSERRRDTPCLPTVVNMEASTNGKKLCPVFVELLMGYPKEWTVLEDWAMQWFQNKRKKRLKS